jgi:hypothetical protein
MIVDKRPGQDPGTWSDGEKLTHSLDLAEVVDILRAASLVRDVLGAVDIESVPLAPIPTTCAMVGVLAGCLSPTAGTLCGPCSELGR